MVRVRLSFEECKFGIMGYWKHENVKKDKENKKEERYQTMYLQHNVTIDTRSVTNSFLILMILT